MNKLILLVFFSFFNLNAQIVKKITINSKILNSKRVLKIWEPENFDNKISTQIIYVFDASLLFNNVCSTVEFYSNSQMDKIPQTIVVGVFYNNLTDRTDVGYVVENESLNAKGEKFFSYFNDEVLTYIGKQYPVKSYNIFVGWSYLALYSDYIIKNSPNLFNAYLLFSPEHKNNQSDYSLLKEKRFYVCSADKDLLKRKQYAEDFYKKLSLNTKITTKFENLDNATHNDIVIKGFPIAIDFLYKDYLNQDNLIFSRGKNFIETYENCNKLNLKNYNCELRKNASNFLNIVDMNIETLSSKSLDTLCNKFYIQKDSEPNLLEIIGSFYRETGEYNKSIYYLNNSIKNYNKNKNISKNAKVNVYVELGNIYLYNINNYDKAIKIFEEGLKRTEGNNFNYFLALTKIKQNKNINDAINYLDKYVENYNSLEDYKLDNAYYQYALCYYNMNDIDKSKLYITKSLEINNKNTNYIELSKKLFDQ